MEDKVIVSHRAALQARYGRAGFARIREALRALVAADRVRGIAARVIYLDSARAMQRLDAAPVAGSADHRGAKTAIDRIFGQLQPDYLMILGGPDIVPHQDLANPLFGTGGDPDPQAWGDLPYACDAAYSRDPARFVGPTRVVARLPDLSGAPDPAHLVALLQSATSWERRPAGEYASCFGLSAAEWQASTRLSLENVFGDAGALLLTPPKGPSHPGAALGARMHFINCHGGQAAPEFYGQHGDSYPVCLRTQTLAGAIRPGTVAAVECCFGGELYDSVTLGVDMPICQTYLEQGACAYFGSTTIAYGPAVGNGAADLICQYFLLNVLNGASVGRAALMARQQFVQNNAQMDPVDLKTLAQFCVYGDPSVHPVAAAPAPDAAPGTTRALSERFRRGERRAALKLSGEFLQRTKPTASKLERDAAVGAAARTALANIARQGGLPRGQGFATFAVEGTRALTRSMGKTASVPSRYHLAIGTPADAKRGARTYKVAVIAKEVAGRIVDYRIYHER